VPCRIICRTQDKSNVNEWPIIHCVVYDIQCKISDVEYPMTWERFACAQAVGE
jgi:hypothetical protein